MARAFATFSLDRAETVRPGRESTSSNLLENAQNIGRLVHESVIIVHIFQISVHFRGSFPRFKVKFDHGTMVDVENFDTRGNNAITSMAIKQQLLTLHRREHRLLLPDMQLQCYWSETWC
jgi:hypothetical protein